MAKLTGDNQFKKREGNLLFYPSRNIMIVRTVSGFTSEALKNSPKYEASRQTANEFGKLSSLCKNFRIALQDALPKQNNRSVVNAFTQKMRQVLSCDTKNARGSRTIADARATAEGMALLLGYEFNPDCKMGLEYHLAQNAVSVNTEGLHSPANTTAVGFRVLQLRFDFTTSENMLQSSDWMHYSKTDLPESIVLSVPKQSDVNGILFTIVEAQCYTQSKAVLIPIESGVEEC